LTVTYVKINVFGVVLENKILLIKIARSQADVMNLNAVKTGTIMHDISISILMFLTPLAEVSP